MSISDKNVLYPPVTQICPDLYHQNPNDISYCMLNDNLSTLFAGATGLHSYMNCSSLFLDTSYNVVGTGPSSGGCLKKTWANTCNIQWDGITNNDSMCFGNTNTILK